MKATSHRFPCNYPGEEVEVLRKLIEEVSDQDLIVIHTLADSLWFSCLEVDAPHPAKVLFCLPHKVEDLGGSVEFTFLTDEGPSLVHPGESVQWVHYPDMDDDDLAREAWDLPMEEYEAMLRDRGVYRYGKP